MAAFDSSLALGFRALELDLVRLVDDTVVLYHDDTLDRLSGRGVNAADLNYQEFCEIFPELLSVYDFVNHYGNLGLDINFEIKDDIRTFELIEPLLDLCDGRVVVSSFRGEIVDHARSRGVVGGYLFESHAEIEAAAHTFESAPRIHIDESLTPLLRELPARDDREIYVYTVNEAAVAQKLKGLGPGKVAGIYTDNPALVAFDSRMVAVVGETALELADAVPVAEAIEQTARVS
ncbi:MAG: glycerophosphodiester phosphodiesterase family protein [Leptospirales bacterium]